MTIPKNFLGISAVQKHMCPIGLFFPKEKSDFH